MDFAVTFRCFSKSKIMCKQIYRHLAFHVAKEMIVQLKANEYKGDRVNWVNLKNDTFIREIRYHTDKLEKAIVSNDNEKMKEYAADISNLVGMFMDANQLIKIDSIDPNSRNKNQTSTYRDS